MDEFSLFLLRLWDMFILAAWVFVPMLIGMLVTFQGSPRLRGWTTVGVVALLVFCVLEFFFAIVQLEGLDTLFFWFRNIVVFLLTLFFAIGMIAGACFRRAVVACEED